MSLPVFSLGHEFVEHFVHCFLTMIANKTTTVSAEKTVMEIQSMLANPDMQKRMQETARHEKPVLRIFAG